ncbi:MAG: tgt, partial [Alphaproteobacteria bacterium]|nr:tgt [Alphaproteobacteria bacterium]
MTFAFDITHKDPNSYARTGRLTTPHGTIETPNFIFCGTKASVKGLSPLQLRAEQVDIILSNTYHLMLSPGADLVAEMGGLHKFMNWDGPMFTDSGGFQIFSLGHGSVADEIKGKANRIREKSILKITEEGAEFRSYLDGRKWFLTPESSIDIQRKLGADLIVQLDECTPYHVDKEYTARSMEMSCRWGDRSLAEWKRKDDGKQKMYGIVQGGVYPDLRKESCEWTKNADFFATAIGGSLGSSKEQMYEVVAMCAPMIHPTRPVHLLGIGSFIDIFTNVLAGIDTFDCVSPTRIAR